MKLMPALYSWLCSAPAPPHAHFLLRVFTVSLGRLKDVADDCTQLSFQENQHLQRFKQVRSGKTHTHAAGLASPWVENRGQRREFSHETINRHGWAIIILVKKRQKLSSCTCFQPPWCLPYKHTWNLGSKFHAHVKNVIFWWSVFSVHLWDENQRCVKRLSFMWNSVK